MFMILGAMGKPILMKDGLPFLYSSRQLAQSGVKALDPKGVAFLRVVPA